MLIDFTALLRGTHQFTVTLTPEWWQNEIPEYQEISIDEPVIANLTVQKDLTGYVIQGSMSGFLRVRCARCLETYVHVLEPDFRLEVFFSSQRSVEDMDMELSEEDFAAATEDESKVDPQELVMEQILLSLPMRFLCRENCLGLCPECGIDLNKKKCDCRRHSGHPAFLKLKELEFRKE